ncbi:MAG: carboxypeptidase-like regulatory domain-containing protein, partial [Gemmatimonadota bacterium]|nr:carboxypeptidase-like regulatory domain-containing protein [Gemmatimonadota bacterium]
MHRSVLSLIALLAASGGQPLAGQGAPAGGRVLDLLSGRPLAGAVVTVEGTPLRATTAADGTFRFTDVPPGVWRFQAAAIGYRPAVRSDVVVAPGRNPDILLRLEPLP